MSFRFFRGHRGRNRDRFFSASHAGTVSHAGAAHHPSVTEGFPQDGSVEAEFLRHVVPAVVDPFHRENVAGVFPGSFAEHARRAHVTTLIVVCAAVGALVSSAMRAAISSPIVS